MPNGRQIWGFDAAGPSGYTKHVAVFETPDGYRLVVKPAMAAPDIVIDIDGLAALTLSERLRDSVLSP